MMPVPRNVKPQVALEPGEVVSVFAANKDPDMAAVLYVELKQKVEAGRLEEMNLSQRIKEMNERITSLEGRLGIPMREWLDNLGKERMREGAKVVSVDEPLPGEITDEMAVTAVTLHRELRELLERRGRNAASVDMRMGKFRDQMFLQFLTSGGEIINNYDWVREDGVSRWILDPIE